MTIGFDPVDPEVEWLDIQNGFFLDFELEPDDLVRLDYRTRE